MKQIATTHRQLEIVVQEHLSHRFDRIYFDVPFDRYGVVGDIDVLAFKDGLFGEIARVCAVEVKSNNRRQNREKALYQLGKYHALLRREYPGIPIEFLYVAQRHVERWRPPLISENYLRNRGGKLFKPLSIYSTV